MSLRTPLNSVLGLGSAKDGTSHFWSQRVSGIALALLGSWFAFCMATLPGFSHVDAITFISLPLNNILLLLLSVTIAYHSYLGVQVVLEDYVYGHALKLVSLIASRFVHSLLAVAAIYATLKIGFSG